MASREDNRNGFIGDSPAFKEMLRRVELAAKFPVPVIVIIIGEPGTGKELTAKRIHDLSSPKAPFITINCAGLPPGIVDSELFGHTSDAYTGAKKDKMGAFERANGGTIVLDEIHALPYEQQTKLNRAIGELEVRRLGDSRVRRLDIRIITATNADLPLMVKQKLFREDLFHRINVFPIVMPPLRDRPEDILPLSQHFLKKVAPQKMFSLESEIFLQKTIWPGNVRVLENTITAAAVMSGEGKIVELSHIKPILKWKLPDPKRTPEIETLTTQKKKQDCEKPQNRGYIENNNENIDRSHGDETVEKTSISHPEESQRSENQAVQPDCENSKGRRINIIISVLNKRSPKSKAELCLETGGSEATIKRYLKELAEKGVIRRLCHGKKTLYMLGETDYPFAGHDCTNKEKTGVSDVFQNKQEYSSTQKCNDMKKNASKVSRLDDYKPRKKPGYIYRELEEVFLSYFQDKNFLNLFVEAIDPTGIDALMACIGVKSRAYFRKKYLRGLLDAGLFEMTIPDKRTSKHQQYRLSPEGKKLLKSQHEKKPGQEIPVSEDVKSKTARKIEDHKHLIQESSCQPFMYFLQSCTLEKLAAIKDHVEPLVFAVGRWVTIDEIARYMGKTNQPQLFSSYISPLVQKGLLKQRTPPKGPPQFKTTLEGMTEADRYKDLTFVAHLLGQREK